MNKQDITNLREAATHAEREPAHQSCGETLLLVCDHLEALVDQVHQEMAATEKAEQERDQLEKLRASQTDTIRDMVEDQTKLSATIVELEEEHAATRLSRQGAEKNYDREQRVVVRLKKEITELEAKLYGTATTKYDRIEEFTKRVEDLEDEITQLKAAQRPRPMDEAPKDGVFKAVLEAIWDRSSSVYRHGPLIGWLPLPDQDEEIAR